MDLDEYQREALSTAVYPRHNSAAYLALGITGEAGEVADKIKKTLRDHDGNFHDGERRQEIALEIGDVMWYCAAMARELGYTLSEIAAMNVTKLQGRSRRGTLHGAGDNR